MNAKLSDKVNVKIHSGQKVYFSVILRNSIELLKCFAINMFQIVKSNKISGRTPTKQIWVY